MNLSVSDQGVQGQRVAFVQLFRGGAPYSTHGERGFPASRWLLVRLGQMRLWSAPPTALGKRPPCAPGSKARRGSSSPSEGRGGEGGGAGARKTRATAGQPCAGMGSALCKFVTAAVN